MTISLWREIQKQNFVLLEDLADFLLLDDANRKRLLSSSRFSLNLPRRLAEKIAKNTLDDPLLRQFVPLQEEEHESNFPLDPVEDARFRKGKKLLHKYRDRVLLLVSSSCAMHCRFCFRKNFPYEKAEKSFDDELEQIKNDTTLSEVILSGGDPLSVSNATLQKLIEALEKIPHIKRLRFHTRFPVGIPERIDDAFLQILNKSRLQTWFILHSNHPRELDHDVLSALKKIAKLGIPILCQTVLLKGVNDTLSTQEELARRLVDNGITPYYLHQLDPVKGSDHFEVSEEEGKRLVNSVSATLSGYGIFRYVKEVPGEPGKTLL